MIQRRTMTSVRRKVSVVEAIQSSRADTIEYGNTPDANSIALKKCAVDLVHRKGEGSFEFIELKGQQ
jgi:hypothetical protein